MLFRSIAIASALSLATSTQANDDGLIRMKLTKRSDHEIVATHLKRKFLWKLFDDMLFNLFVFDDIAIDTHISSSLVFLFHFR